MSAVGHTANGSTGDHSFAIPTDFSPAASEAFRAAVSLARTCGGEVVVTHVSRVPAVVGENGRVTAGRAPKLEEGGVIEKE